MEDNSQKSCVIIQRGHKLQEKTSQAKMNLVPYTASTNVKMRHPDIVFWLHLLLSFIFLVCGEERFRPSWTRASHTASADHVRTGPPALSQHRYPFIKYKITFTFSLLLAVVSYKTVTTSLKHLTACFSPLTFFLQSTETWNPTTSWCPCPMPTVGSGPWFQTLACVRS